MRIDHVQRLCSPTSASRARPSPTALLNEDWLAVILGLFIFVLGLAALVHVDLIGWVVSTSVWSNFGLALGPASKGYAALGGIGALLATYAALTLVLTAGAAALKSDVEALCARLHRGVLDRLCELDRRQLRAFRRGDAGRAAEIRHLLVAEADQRRRLHFRADRGPDHRQFPAALCRPRSRTRCGRSSTSKSPSSFSAASSP